MVIADTLKSKQIDNPKSSGFLLKFLFIAFVKLILKGRSHCYYSCVQICDCGLS